MQLSLNSNLVIALGIFNVLTTTVHAQTLQPWMSPEVGDAWKSGSGFKGQGTTLIFVDDFSSTSKLTGNFSGVTKTQQHGFWTSQEGNLIAPSATLRTQDFNTNSNSVQLDAGRLNTLNLSYGMYASSSYNVNQITWSKREQSIIGYAQTGSAVIAKAAGNDYGTAVGSSYKGKTDYLNTALIGAQTAIFVGALNSNGTISNKASISSYSNIAGSNKTVQDQFLMVGVTGGNDPNNKLLGTSFAAPIVAGYSAILGSKFTTATPSQISSQLLSTARKDTINNYNPAIHGRGEASITKALAPVGVQ